MVQSALRLTSTEAVVNDPSNDVDFRVESNGNTHMLFVDGGNDRVGVGIVAYYDITRQFRDSRSCSNSKKALTQMCFFAFKDGNLMATSKYKSMQ